MEDKLEAFYEEMEDRRQKALGIKGEVDEKIERVMQDTLEAETIEETKEGDAGVSERKKEEGIPEIKIERIDVNEASEG